jgi:threonine dehydrogenase-like Zn-dependent dehydrogenase
VCSSATAPAVAAEVKPGSTVVVAGDGAVGLCGVIVAREVGAARVIAMSRHTSRQQLAIGFGARPPASSPSAERVTKREAEEAEARRLAAERRKKERENKAKGQLTRSRPT